MITLPLDLMIFNVFFNLSYSIIQWDEMDEREQKLHILSFVCFNSIHFENLLKSFFQIVLLGLSNSRLEVCIFHTKEIQVLRIKYIHAYISFAEV